MPNMQMLPIVAGVALAALAVVGVVVARRYERERIEALGRMCSEMGFAFDPVGELSAFRALADFPIYDRGHSKRVKNVMTGRIDGREVRLFEYQFTTGGGKNRHTAIQTVALFPRGGTGLPDFTLAPENVLHRVGQMFGYQDIDFDSYPDFSSQYLLRGADEPAIRAAFSPMAISYLEQQRGWTVEVKAESVAIYRAGKRCKPADLRSFVDGAIAVLRSLGRR
jgi:hypothetical protein